MKIDALAFSWAGDKYLGRSYEEMDCQAFVERCMRDVGYCRDLGGSNSWYRECLRSGWAGTPEQCVQLFGVIPKGALLFIWEPVSDSTPEKYRKDGIGDITHMGIKTGRGDGAIHSSFSRGMVATSVFKDRTIKNGGWNRVGLLNAFSYGKTVDWYLEHAGIGENPGETETEGEPMQQAKATSGNGTPINLRKTKGGDLLDRVPDGDTVEILESGEKWSRIRWKGKTGWMMSQFLVADDSGLPDEDFGPGDLDGDPAGDQDGGGKIALYFTAEELGQLLPIMQSACEQIIRKVGRG